MNLSLLVAFLFAVVFGATEGKVITYYIDANFKKFGGTVDLTKQCYNMPRDNDKMSSINTGGACVEIFVNNNCNGYSYRVSPGTTCHSNLKQCGMNDKVSSLRLCWSTDFWRNKIIMQQSHFEFHLIPKFLCITVQTNSEWLHISLQSSLSNPSWIE